MIGACKQTAPLRETAVSFTCSVGQEMIATMLGVRCEGVTEAAGELQDAGLINYKANFRPFQGRRRILARDNTCRNAANDH